MSNICFAFGPDNSYFYNAPSSWTYNDLPGGIRGLLVQPDCIKDAYNIALGLNGAYYIGFVSSHGYDHCRYFGLPKALEDWLGDAWEFKRDIPTLRITLGPNGSYFAIDKDGYAWDNLPESLEEEVATCCGSEGADDPKLVALGADGGFLMITQKGSYTYDLTGFSQKLHEAFNGSTSEVGNLDDIRYFSLSAHEPGRFIGFFQDGRPFGSTPDAWLEKCDPVSKSIAKDLSAPPTPAPSVTPVYTTSATCYPVHRPVPAVVPAPRQRPKQSSSGLGNLLFKSALSIGNAVLKAETQNAGGGGGGGQFVDYSVDYSGGGGNGMFDMNSSWAPIDSAASDPIQ